MTEVDIPSATLSARASSSEVSRYFAELALSTAMFDIRRAMFGKELDLGRGSLESVMFLEGRQRHLADKAWHLALLGRLHRQHDPDRLDQGDVVVIQGARPRAPTNSATSVRRWRKILRRKRG